ncbi:MAG: ureidoglycolate lyase [Candidatus Competibacteraceae bacterium]|nr:ureidoglycolate lyase [Candidatus Competibacteraceae bacterium]
MATVPNYLNPDLPRHLARIPIPVVTATPSTLSGYGQLVNDPEAVHIEIVRWPAQGWRPVDADSGDEGGTTEGTFVAEWKGDVLYGCNMAVNGHYILGYAVEPTQATEDHDENPSRLFLWHANYHPDGGQLFFPLEPKPFLVPLARPGDDVKPEDFVCFWFSGQHGLYIHPNIWHEGVFPLRGQQRFFDKQGAVHGRVSVDFSREFNCLLEIPIENQS